MTNSTEYETNANEHGSQHGAWIAILATALLLVAGFAGYESHQIQGLAGHLTTTEQQLADLKTADESTAAQQRQSLADMRNAMDAQQNETTAELSKTARAVQRKAETLAAGIKQEQAAHAAALDAEVTHVRETAEQTSTKLDGVQGEVSAVRDDVDSTKTDIAKSASDLQSVRGDLGVMSGLIATNSGEIEMLRKLGDRTITEFTLTKSGGMVKVGDIQVRLVRTVPKRNAFTLVVNADDKLIEKRDKTTNEPVQFYVTSRARQPYEIVVNEVSKAAVKGYLAAPKVQTARNEHGTE